ncbi:MAG: alpha/beta hydrolase family protein [Solirubrobacterales bacterium]
MAGSFYQAQVKSGKSKSAASKATTAAMKGVKGFYGFNLKAKDIPAKHGTLIWSKKGKNRPEAKSTDLVLYSSRSISGKKIVVSGTVMTPKTPMPKGGYPVITWAHGTVGLADPCAPSKFLNKTADFDYGSGELIGDWLENGYAVVATDYEGLGTPDIHPYLIGASEGRGVLDIVPAARQLSSKLSKKTVLAGHSQGGQAILFAASLASTWGKGTNYLGTVSYAPASNFEFQAQNIGALDGPGGPGISALAISIGRGMVAGNSSIKPADVFTEQAMSFYPDTETLCYRDLATKVVAAGLQPSRLLKVNWGSATPSGRLFQQELIKQNPAVKVTAPVLIAQGTADTTVFPLITDRLVPQIEAVNSPGEITYQKFTGADHGSILIQSKPEVYAFIDGLLAP